jgi:hypothetical protein
LAIFPEFGIIVIQTKQGIPPVVDILFMAYGVIGELSSSLGLWHRDIIWIVSSPGETSEYLLC